ncbi:hypothetical protein [Virgibacillus salexigens]|uniref:Uncharacterized protein n=1 Tax=Virgibacillus massiliensis TaxID=1462526 RepID=A0A024QHB8_9BACI|nr:hypothetical protein [Virgibacillus massiliensis]CDQ41938.1 hypothetical protein BN990_04317 [Virgibacillus massiliensis]
MTKSQVNKNVTNMSNYELLNFGSEISSYNELIQNEWFKRHQMNFPYMLDVDNRIVHGVIKEVIPDENCDRLILEQANKIRSDKYDNSC